MSSTAPPVRARTARGAAVVTAVLAMSTVTAVSGTAHAATKTFGSPSRSHRGSFGVSPTDGWYDGAEAVTQLRALATATRSASAAGALINGWQSSAGQTSTMSVAVDGTRAAKVRLTGLLSYQLLESATTDYVTLESSSADMRAALALLHAQNPHYVAEPATQPLINPADMIEQLYATDTPAIGTMTRSEHQNVIRYQITVNVPSSERDGYPSTVTVITDRTGRLTGFSAATSTGSASEQYLVGYGRQTVTLPNPQDVVDGEQLDRAVASLHLSETLALITMEAYADALPSSGSGTETDTQFRASVRSVAADPENGMGGIAITVTDVSNGVTLSATNPFSSAVATVRAVLDGQGQLILTNSTGGPIGPNVVARSAAERTLRKPAVHLSFRR